MIDTVILKIPKSKVNQIDDNFWQSKQWGAYSFKFIRNMTSIEKANQQYRPRITGQIRTGRAPYLKVEFSCPKLVYGNNLAELKQTDFEVIIELLQKNLSEIGIITTTETLRNAEVLAFHPSKNIQLMSGYTPSFVIKELQKINIKKIFDLNKVDFRNDGQSLQIYSNSHSLVFYDKIADLKRPLKRAIDRDQTTQQLSLFNDIQANNPRLEILRMEVRLCTRRKINSLMKKLNLPIKPTFQDLFKNNLCQKVLWDYWEQIISNQNNFLLETNTNPHKLLRNIIRCSPKEITAKEAIYLVGLKTLAQNEGGMNTLRTIVEKSYTTRTWARTLANTKKLNDISSSPKQEWVKQIEEQLQTYKPLTL